MSDFLKINVDDPNQEIQRALPVAGVGELLRSRRLKRNLSQEAVAKELRIDVRQLNALENDQFEIFSGPVFVKGYLRNYAKLLDIDPDPIIKEFNEVSKIKTPGIVPIKRVMTSAGGGSQIPLSKFTPVILTIVTVAVVVWLGNNLYSFIKEMGQTEIAEVDENGLTKIDVLNRFQEVQERVTSEQESTPGKPPVRAEPATTQTDPVANQAVAAPAQVKDIPAVEPIVAPPAKVSALFRFTDDSWIEVYDANDERLLARIGKAGSETTVEGMPPLRVVLGNAPGVEVELEGKPYKFRVSQKTQVARFKLGQSN